MHNAPFDPTKAVTFDLAHGHVHLEDAPERVLVPAKALAQLCAAAGADATRALGRSIGEPMGRRLARRLGETAGATIDAVVDHLGGELSLAGLGSLGAERWGRALVLVVDESPLEASGDALLAAVLEAALAASTGREATCVVLARDAGRVRLLVVGAGGAEKVRSWLGSGTSWGDVLVRLHESAAEPRGEA